MKHQYSPSGPALGTHQGEIPFYTRPPLPYTVAAPQQQGSPAYVVYKVGGDPGDYQFLYEPPKEIPHGYVCTYVPDCNNWMSQVRQRRGETVSEYIQRFRTVRNRCYSVRLSEKEAVEMAIAGLSAPLKDVTFQADYNSLAHMVQKLTSYEQRHPELYQDKFKRVALIEMEEDEDSAGDQEVAVAEWTRGQSPCLASG
ncbi:hypothetical protein QYE76_043782 [Lolium multiflorum]|uniref:Retrotransposon gag domain-containing protein n=1 Tax=Lolium multiflorum TaxID=4521 RepID=A0AAD8TJN2_LOLMU|nr:hypothetical protein QYE76_043782 [Lolium multiflorum]